MQRGEDPARTFKTMAEDLKILQPTSNSEDADSTSCIDGGHDEIKRRLSFLSEKDISTLEEPNTTCKVLTLQSAPDDSNSCRLCAKIAGQLPPQAANTRLKATAAIELTDSDPEHRLNPTQQCGTNTEDKENTATITAGRSHNRRGCPCFPNGGSFLRYVL